MDNFLPHQDPLSQHIQEKSADLYGRLMQLSTGSLGMPEHCLAYYQSSHSKRLFFSIETSARLLYRCIMLSRKITEELVVMDYGAGVGTLYLLAKMIGCKKVLYNDHLDDWRISAQLIAEAIGVNIDEYIVGDITDCLNRLKQENIACDIITSRNVVEHIYKLNHFFTSVHELQPGAIVYSSTTANYLNPASRIKHYLWHKKWEKVYRQNRVIIIKREAPGISEDKINLLAGATRGLAADDLSEAISSFLLSGKMPDTSVYRSNTCDPSNGVWAEHMLKPSEYREQINEKNFTVSFEPGFWDTHYSKNYKNAAGKYFNKIICTVPGE
ncbi:MAG: hypothetical protein ABI687_08055 [Flavitalea sp.]